MNRSGAYLEMEREYVTAPPEQEHQFTLTAIASRYNRGTSSVARMSRIKGWKAKRLAYRHKSGDIIAELDADTYAVRIHALHGKFLDVAEKTLDTYEKAVEAGDVKITPGDVAKMVATVETILNHAKDGDEETDGSDDIRIPASIGREWFGRLEQLARERAAQGAVGSPAQPKLIGSGQGQRIQVR